MLLLPDVASWVATRDAAALSKSWHQTSLARWPANWRQFWNRHLDALATELARGKRDRRAGTNKSIPSDAIPYDESPSDAIPHDASPSDELPAGEQSTPTIPPQPDESTHRASATNDGAGGMANHRAANSIDTQSIQQPHSERDG